MRPEIASPPRLANREMNRRPLISLTPLIDVVFILLVFFMLASSFLDWRMIELDAPGRTGNGAPMEGAMLVEVRHDGLRLSGHHVSLDALAARLGKRAAREPGLRVLVKPDAGVELQRAVDILDRLAVAGVADLAMIGGSRAR